MLAEEWLSSSDPIAMLEFLQDTLMPYVFQNGSRLGPLGEDRQGSSRKFHLFACACCRRVRDRIPEACNRDAVVAVEDFLDGRISEEQLLEALRASAAVECLEDGSGRRTEPGYWIVKYLGRGFYKFSAATSALLAAGRAIFMADETYGKGARIGRHLATHFTGDSSGPVGPFRWPLPLPATVAAERAAQASLLRCIFGNPFRPVSTSHVLSWKTGPVARLSQDLHERQDFHLLPLLADVLEDAGCSDAELLGHCRQPGEHTRGCWAVDLLSGLA